MYEEDLVAPGVWGWVGSGVLLVRVGPAGPEVFLGFRSAHVHPPLLWGIPGGQVPFAMRGTVEAIRASAVTEFEEEVGYFPPEARYTGLHFLYPDDSPAALERVIQEYGDGTRPQYHAFLYEIPPGTEIHPDAEAEGAWENDDFGWFPVGDLPQDAIPGLEDEVAGLLAEWQWRPPSAVRGRTHDVDNILRAQGIVNDVAEWMRNTPDWRSYFTRSRLTSDPRDGYGYVTQMNRMSAALPAGFPLLLALVPKGRGHGYGHVDGNAIIVLAVLDERGLGNPYLPNWLAFSKPFEHELVHHLDRVRAGKHIGLPEQAHAAVKAWREGEGADLTRYYNDPAELNARFHDGATTLVSLLGKDRGDLSPVIWEKLGATPADFRARFWQSLDPDFVRHLTPQNRRRLETRIYQLYQSLRTRELARRSQAVGRRIVGARNPSKKPVWEMTQEEFIQASIEMLIERWKRNLAHDREVLAGLSKRATRKRKDLELRIASTQSILDEVLAGQDQWVRRNLTDQYLKHVTQAIQSDKAVPAEIIAADAALQKAKTDRERYLKGRHTSFANLSAAVDASMLAEGGYKVKRQDGKPIKPEQKAEIAAGVAELESVLGPLAEVFRAPGLTIAHTSGTYPFLMSNAGGLYSPDDRTVTMGIVSKVRTGAPIKALAHEFGHFIDFEAGRVLNFRAMLPGTRGKARYSTAISNYEGAFWEREGSDPEGRDLILRATAMFTSEDRLVDRLLKLRKKDMVDDPAKQAEAEWAKVKLGNYWRSPVEVWARLVEQYVAHRLGYPADLVSADHRYPYWMAYWSVAEMEELAPAIERQIQRRLDLIVSSPTAEDSPATTGAMRGAAPGLTGARRPGSSRLFLGASWLYESYGERHRGLVLIPVDEATLRYFAALRYAIDELVAGRNADDPIARSQIRTPVLGAVELHPNGPPWDPSEGPTGEEVAEAGVIGTDGNRLSEYDLDDWARNYGETRFVYLTAAAEELLTETFDWQILTSVAGFQFTTWFSDESMDAVQSGLFYPEVLEEAASLRFFVPPTD